MASKLYNKLLWSTIGLLLLTFIGVCVSVNIEPGLVFTEEPHHGELVVLRGSSVTLNCSAASSIFYTDNSPDLVQIQWLKDGTPITDTDIRHNLLPHGLYLRRVTRKTEGHYQCTATNSGGTIISHTLHLRTAVLNRFTEEPVDTFVTEGDLVRLVCSITGTQTPQITWQKDKQPITDNQRYTTLPNGILQIRDSQTSDSGLYRCLASNIARERQSSEATLTVSPQQETDPQLPQILQEIGNVKAVLGSTVLIECAATGTPTVTWTGPDDTLVKLDGRMSIVGQGNLLIKSIQVSDEGPYVCNAHNPVGSISSQGNLQVLVPPILSKKSENRQRPLTAATTFNCDFDMLPLSDITWTKNGKLIDLESDRIQLLNQGTMLVISQGQASDSGYYQCWAANEAGSAYGLARLVIFSSTNVPDPPTKLEARPVASNELEIQWEESPSVHDHIPTLGYSVHYVPLIEGGVELQEVVKQTRVVIDSLRSHTNYSVWVLAYNEKGASQRSASVTQMTGEAAFTLAPAINVKPDITSLTVTWNEVDKSKGTILKYIILHRLHGLHMPTEIEVPQSARGDDASEQDYKYVIEGLEPRTKYDVQVLGLKSVLTPPTIHENILPWITQITGPSTNLGAPEAVNMEVQVINSTSLLVMWQPVEEMGSETLGYKLYVSEPGQKPKRHFIFVKGDRRQVLTKLAADTWYELKLQAFNSFGEGEPTVHTVYTDGGGARPLPPLFIEARPLNSTAIKISWNTPEVTPAPVSSYTVRYTPVMVKDGVEVSDETLVHTVTSTSLQVVVKTLQPFTTYKFAVKSHAGDTSGEFSHDMRCRTKEGRPGVPEDFEWLVKNNIVELSWKPPKQPNGVIVNYMVSYTNDPTNEEHWNLRIQNGTSRKTALMGLLPDADYYVKMSAVTSVGAGPSTLLLHIHTSGQIGGIITSERDIGIIAGVCIGGSCIIICAIIVLLRNRCCPPTAVPPPPHDHDPNASYNGNGCVADSSGNGSIPGYNQDYHHFNSTDYHEMDSFTPLTGIGIHENEESDTKGGYHAGRHKGGNGKVNGLNGLNGIHRIPANGIRSVPNGKIQRPPEYIDRQPQVPERSTSLLCGEEEGDTEGERLLPPSSPPGTHMDSSSSPVAAGSRRLDATALESSSGQSAGPDTVATGHHHQHANITHSSSDDERHHPGGSTAVEGIDSEQASLAAAPHVQVVDTAPQQHQQQQDRHSQLT